jgi:hypothetical protein
MPIEPTDRAEPMQGLAEYLRRRALYLREESQGPDQRARSADQFEVWASDVEASRQRPAAQAASAECISVEMMEEAARKVGFDPIPGRLILLAGVLNGMLAATPTGERPAAPAPDEDLMDAFEVNGLTGSVNGQLQDYSRLAAAPAQASSALFDDLRALLEEAYGFAAMSPRGRENINAALDLIDTIRAEAAPAQAAATDDAHEQNLWIRELLELARQWHATRDGTPSKAEAYSALWKHAHNIGPHWRARALLAQASPAQPSGVDAQWVEKARKLSEDLSQWAVAMSVMAGTPGFYEKKEGRDAAREALRTHLFTALTGAAKEVK